MSDAMIEPKTTPSFKSKDSSMIGSTDPRRAPMRSAEISTPFASFPSRAIAGSGATGHLMRVGARSNQIKE